MKIILLDDVRNAGQEIRREGRFGWLCPEFSFPNKLAESATPSALKKLDALKAEHTKNEEAS